MNFRRVSQNRLVESVDPRAAEATLAAIDLYRATKGNASKVKKRFTNGPWYLFSDPGINFSLRKFEEILETDPEVKNPKNVTWLEELFNFIYTDSEFNKKYRTPYWANPDYYKAVKEQVEDYLSSNESMVGAAPFRGLVEKISKVVWFVKKNKNLDEEETKDFVINSLASDMVDPAVLRDIEKIAKISINCSNKPPREDFFNSIESFLAKSNLLDTFVKRGKEEVEAALDRIVSSISPKKEEKKDFPAEVPEADIDIAPWGRIAFAPLRRGVPPEKNTYEEEEVQADLVNHVVEDDPLNPETSKKIAAVLNKGWYKPVIKEPKQEYIFRGMNVSQDWLESAGISGLPERRQGSEELSFVYVPSAGGSSSWTTSSDVARDFSRASQDRFSIVLVAKRSENPEMFIVGKGGFYKLDAAAEFSDEEEAIALGRINVMKIYWEKIDNGKNRGYMGPIDEE